LNIQNAKFELTAVKPSQYPQTNLPEIAFVGRSNVGKSSLINALLNRKSLARTSSEPGKTRTVNFFNIDEALYFVDLPGYGYAKVSKTEKASWSDMIEHYLQTRKQLQLIFLLLDIRHEPSSDDRLMMEWLLQTQRHFAVIATKADKLSRSKVKEHLRSIQKSLQLQKDCTLLPFSSETKHGIQEIWDIILKSNTKPLQ
jgi:GTP-binding protein